MNNGRLEKFLSEERPSVAYESGIVESEPEFSHSIDTEDVGIVNIYEFVISTIRMNGKLDYITVMAEESLVKGIKKGNSVLVEGSIRSHYSDKHEDDTMCDDDWSETEDHDKPSSDYKVFVLARQLLNEDAEEENICFLKGNLISKRDLRTTRGHHQIIEFMMKTLEPNYHKESFVPCTAWDEYARRVNEMPYGVKLALSGRLRGKKKVNGGIHTELSVIDFLPEADNF